MYKAALALVAFCSIDERLKQAPLGRYGSDWGRATGDTYYAKKAKVGKPVGSKINPHFRNHTLLTSATQILRLETENSVTACPRMTRDSMSFPYICYS